MHLFKSSIMGLTLILVLVVPRVMAVPIQINYQGKSMCTVCCLMIWDCFDSPFWMKPGQLNIGPMTVTIHP